MSEKVEWVVTMPNPRVVSHTADAGQRGWRLHAVRKSELSEDKAVRSLCGLRPSHGWGYDLFIEEECARCSALIDRMDGCYKCRGTGSVVELVSNEEGRGRFESVDCDKCNGAGFTK